MKNKSEDEELTYDELQDRINQQVSRIEEIQKGKENETGQKRKHRTESDKRPGLFKRFWSAVQKCFRLVLSIFYSI